MKKIMIVDDQPIIRKMILIALQDKRFVLTEACDGDSAYQLILKDKPDGIVLDVMMPGQLNGFQLCERIKQSPELSGIHVVLVTACGQIADQEFGRALGADAYFVKPFSPVALATYMKEALLKPEEQ
ncbi:MAG: two-component system response regulator [Gallionellales bacterium RIFOXYD12_FULL_53_10]|jgi:CheY-like chemotaxis protein|nr:response regulator [Gallionella sp.]OGS66563.1 MAG: two-component system response regulator [Gallionellales bacterium GWA2_54_124]OGS68897.1 MAG: two-component system response regulator [Gallionellales bacterium GWA2_54_124]OGT20185.1 MAG: two-component system response regulator [Gallionellales bacterium RIFOXYD12_FULL_53_10]OGT22819.1 MAG: two-component system response regulator [Gallionellales bacterium RIFOXYD2_FULL_52_7]